VAATRAGIRVHSALKLVLFSMRVAPAEVARAMLDRIVKTALIRLFISLS